MEPVPPAAVDTRQIRHRSRRGVGRAHEGRRRDRPVLQHRQRRTVPQKRDHSHRTGLQETLHHHPQHHRTALFGGQDGRRVFSAKGFRNFAFYGTRGIDFSDERCQGFRETIEAANPEFTFSSLRSSAQDDLWYYDSTQAHHVAAVAAKPVAIMACDDNQAYHITEACLQIEGGGNSRIPNDIAILGVDNDETICKLSTPNLSSLNQGVEQGGYDVARLIDRLIRNPEAEWEDVMVMPTHIVTRQSTDIYANNDPHIAEVLRYIHENISQKITVNELVKLVPLSRRLLETHFKKSMGTSIYDYIIQVRIEKMMQLLCEGQSVSEAAAELGFSDIKNVSRTFRQAQGHHPSEYREQFAPKRR
ncbi:MAG: substrate-binding domain-containing protein [Alistipes finegoldii]